MSASIPACAGRRYAAISIGVTLGAVGLAVWLLNVGQQQVIYDARGYYELAALIGHNGLFGYSIAPDASSGILPTLLQVKPNGYPLFVAVCGVLSTFDVDRLHQVVFAVQLLIYLLVCHFAARRLGRVFQSRTIELVVFAATALNPLLLIQTTELLSDLLSATLVYLAVVLALPLPGPTQHPVPARPFFLSFLVASLATVVRSANVVIMAALALIWLLRWLLFRDIRWRLTPAVVVLAVLPFIPQVVNNYRAFGSTSPFVARNEYAGDLGAGASTLKYLSVVIPGQNPQWIYENPFLPAGTSSLDTLLQHQLPGYVATLALHGFAVLDQDYPFTYVTDLRPWYRWPISIADYCFLGLAGLGMYLGLRASGGSRRDTRWFAFLATLLASAACLAIYLPPHVENRYSMPIYPLLTLSAAFASLELLRSLRSTGRRPFVVASTTLLTVFVAMSAALSNWMQTLQRALP